MTYLERAEKLKEYLGKKSSEKDNANSKDEDSEDDEKEMMNQLKNAIVTEKPDIKWSDVAGLSVAKEALNEASILPMNHPHLFNDKRIPIKSILLFGPPGCGKNYLMKALANEAKNFTFLSISSSDLTSKYIGDSEKMVKNLFALSRKHEPSIVFIDYIDFIMKDENSMSQAVKGVRTELLIQMQNTGNDMKNIVVLAATSMPWLLDTEFLRRFQKRIYVSLPDEESRLAILKKNIGTISNSITEDQMRILAQKTDRFSCADISVLVRDALMQPIRKVQIATHFKKVCSFFLMFLLFIKFYLSSFSS